MLILNNLNVIMPLTFRVGGRHFPTWFKSWAKLLTVSGLLWNFAMKHNQKTSNIRTNYSEHRIYFNGWALEVGFDARKAYGICSEAMFLILGRPLRYSDTTSSCSFSRSSKVRRCRFFTTWQLCFWVAIEVWCLRETNSRNLLSTLSLEKNEQWHEQDLYFHLK